MKIYLAGPMRNVPEFNHPAFNAATAALREAGHEVFNPAEYDRSNGHDFTGHDGTEDLSAIGFDLRRALGTDLAWITANADAVVVLPGWEKSAGARAETATAEAIGLPVYEAAAFLAGAASPLAADLDPAGFEDCLPFPEVAP